MILASSSIAAVSTRLCADASVCAPDGFFILFRSRGGTDVAVNKRAFVYPASHGKESAMKGCRSCPARPDADVMKRRAAVRSHAVVADEDVDPPAVEKRGRGPDAFADEDPGLHAFEQARMQTRLSARIAQSHDIALRDPEPRGVGRIDEHFGPLLPR